MGDTIAGIAQALAGRAEAVCRHYLSQGRREGRYWLVGDARNTPGRSLFVRLAASPDGRGVAGKWTDAASGEHGDLLDIIALALGHDRLRETLDEARRFLALPIPEPGSPHPVERRFRAPSGTPEAARRLFAASASIIGSPAAAYLRKRAITRLAGCDALRFHPRCYYRPSDDDPPDTRTAWQAIIAAVTDAQGIVTGVHRTWLDAGARDKAPIASPRRAMGRLLGGGVRFGPAGPAMIVGEGIETILSLRMAAPRLPMIAGLSSAHLAAIAFPARLRRLYIARDDDPAGAAAVTSLSARAVDAGIEPVPLEPQLGDFNDDLRQFGLDHLVDWLRGQFHAADADALLAAAR